MNREQKRTLTIVIVGWLILMSVVLLKGRAW